MQKLKVLSVTVGLLTAASGCGIFAHKGGGGGGGSGDSVAQQDHEQDSSADDTAVTPPTPEELALQAGVRNYAQINATMSVLTGVSPNATNVKAAFDAELSSSLPAGNDAQAFLGSHQVAVTKLAVEYCDALFEDATLRAQMIPGFNFAATPAAAFTAAGKALVTKSMIDRFFGIDLADRPGSDVMQPIATKLLEDILSGKSQTDVNITKNAIKGVCIALLASAPVSLF